MNKKTTKNFAFDYMWVMAILCFLMIAISLGFCSSGRNLYLTAITDALDIPRGAFSLTNTIRFLTSTVMSLFLGKLVNRFGTKKLVLAGFVSLICFALINAYTKSIFVFYIGSLFLGIGVSWTGTAMVSIIVNKWVKQNKGTMTGIILAANGIGGAVAVQIISPIIFQEGNPFGYRNSYLLVASILTVMTFLVIIFFRENPKGQEKSTPVATRKKYKTRGEGWVGVDFSEALKKPYFYLAVFCMFGTGMTLQGISGIGLPHMYDMGFDKGFVATISSIGSICLTVSKVSSGISYDRFGLKKSMNICFVCASISLGGLIVLKNTVLGQIIAVVRSVVSSFALPLETVMLPLFAMEFFGNKDFNKFVGVFSAANYLGFAIGSPLGNLCYDIFGNYIIAFYIFSAVLLIVIILMQYVYAVAKRDRKIIESTFSVVN